MVVIFLVFIKSIRNGSVIRRTVIHFGWFILGLWVRLLIAWVILQ
jgi:hypothetical protein